jgi:uncharacterized membrane protein YgaE (UPF0421/DUF939 family)
MNSGIPQTRSGQIGRSRCVPSRRTKRDRRSVLLHSTRTGVAAITALLAARALRLPNVYWAPFTTLVITQSSLGALLNVSWERFVGTALGAIVGAVVASYFGPEVFVFGTSVLILGLLCALVHLQRSAYHFGAITLAIVLLVPRTSAAWQVAFHRFTEVSVGIGVALAFAVVWPEEEEDTFVGPVRYAAQHSFINGVGRPVEISNWGSVERSNDLRRPPAPSQ